MALSQREIINPCQMRGSGWAILPHPARQDQHWGGLPLFNCIPDPTIILIKVESYFKLVYGPILNPFMVSFLLIQSACKVFALPKGVLDNSKAGQLYYN